MHVKQIDWNNAQQLSTFIVVVNKFDGFIASTSEVRILAMLVCCRRIFTWYPSPHTITNVTYSDDVCDAIRRCVQGHNVVRLIWNASQQHYYVSSRRIFASMSSIPFGNKVQTLGANDRLEKAHTIRGVSVFNSHLVYSRTFYWLGYSRLWARCHW